MDFSQKYYQIHLHVNIPVVMKKNSTSKFKLFKTLTFIENLNFLLTFPIETYQIDVILCVDHKYEGITSGFLCVGARAQAEK